MLATAAGAGAEHAPLAAASERRLAELGAAVARCALTRTADPAGEEERSAGRERARRSGGADGGRRLGATVGGRGAGAARVHAGELGRDPRGRERGELERDGGLVVVIAPAPGAGEHAEAARAGLENLARTLSIEWARFATRAVAVARQQDGSRGGSGDWSGPPRLAGGGPPRAACWTCAGPDGAVARPP